MPTPILIVDDDPHIREVIVFALEKAGRQVVQAKDGREALQRFREQPPALVILDITMPEMDGLEVCREIRKDSQTPILFLSSRDDEIDRVVGLEIGGDDYVTKPFSPRELVARVNAILKRVRSIEPAAAPQGKELAHGKLRLLPEQHLAFWGASAIELTATEFTLLRGLLSQPGRVYSREQLMNMAYSETVYVSDRTIDSHIRHIRQKCVAVGAAHVIETVHGVGYKLGSCA